MSRAAVLALLACTRSASANTLSCVSDYDASTDYFPDKVYPSYSELWTSEYFNSYKARALARHDASQRSSHRVEQVMNLSYTGVSIVAYQCGTPMPNVLYATDYIEVPVSTVAVTSTTNIPWVELLGKRSSMVA